MKKIAVIAVALLLCLVAVGCSMLERSYTSVQPHSSSYYESEDKSVLRAETYQDLVNDLLVLIGTCSQQGTIWLYDSDALGDVQQAMEKACQEVQNETPMGAYAVEYMTYTISEPTRTHTEIQLTISYRRSAEEITGMVNITGVTALRDLLVAAADKAAKQLAVQLGNFYDDPGEIYAIVSEVAAEHNGGHWQVQFYPDETRAGIVEIVMEE